MIESDTIMLDTFGLNHSPMKASMYSAVFPGMGQIYNRKYWKLPIVYGGMGALIYSSIWNSQEYQKYFDKYKYMTENDLEEWEDQTIKEVEFYKKEHLRYKNLFIILTVAFYGLQIVDASVDAHLIDYDISDDLGLTIDPVMLNRGVNSAAMGFRCCLSF